MTSARRGIARRAARGIASVITILAPVLVGTSAAYAIEPKPFYEGKQVTIVVGNPAGSGYDAYARLVARHLGKHLPGSPGFIIQNMPGAGSIVAAQFLSNVAAKDGTIIGLLVPGAFFEPLIEDESKFHYSPGKFEFIGSADSGTRLCFTTRDSGIKTIADASKGKVIVASTAPQSSATDYANFMNVLAGTKFQVVMGYKGPADLLLAMERGEAAGVCALDSATLASIRPDWIETGKVNLLVQAGLEADPAIKAPPIWDYIKGDNRPVAELIVGQQEFGRPFVAPPGTPKAQVKTLQTAFMATMRDPQLVAEAGKMRIGVKAKSGEEIAAIVRKMYDSPPELVARVKKTLRP